MIFWYSGYMTRRNFIALLFGLLFVLAQQATIIHPYVHTADWQKVTSGSKNSHKTTEACAQCLAHAGIDNAISPQTFIFFLKSADFTLSSHTHYSVISNHSFSYHSRAPPVIA